jgi:hypothetical protein
VSGEGLRILGVVLLACSVLTGLGFLLKPSCTGDYEDNRNRYLCVKDIQVLSQCAQLGAWTGVTNLVAATSNAPPTCSPSSMWLTTRGASPQFTGRWTALWKAAG